MGPVTLWLAAFLAILFAFAALYSVSIVIDTIGRKLGPLAGVAAFLAVIAAGVATIVVVVVGSV